MGELKTSDHIQTKIKIQNSSQEPPAPIKAPNQDLKDRAVLWPFKNKIPSQETPASVKAPNKDLKNMDALCTSKI